MSHHYTTCSVNYLLKTPSRMLSSYCCWIFYQSFDENSSREKHKNTSDLNECETKTDGIFSSLLHYFLCFRLLISQARSFSCSFLERHNFSFSFSVLSSYKYFDDYIKLKYVQHIVAREEFRNHCTITLKTL